MKKGSARSVVSGFQVKRTNAEVLKTSWHVANILRVAFQKRSYSRVLLYTPVVEWREVDLTSLIEMVPRISFDFLEKEQNAAFPDEHYDAIVVPLNGFNERGFRLGHGGGWYDKYLSTQSTAYKIGVGYENTLVDFDEEPHDIRMDMIVTDKSVRTYKT